MMPDNAQDLQCCKAMESGLMNLPVDIFHMILDEIIITLELRKTIRLRLVNKLLATEILLGICRPGSLDANKEAIFERYWTFRNMSKVFKVGLLLPRLSLSYAVQSHYLSSILEAEELLTGLFPDLAKKQQHEFRYALCAAETWQFRELFLGDVEPIFPQRKPPVHVTSPLADALSAAAYMGNMELVSKLLRAGADQNFHAGYLRPPLQQAASRGHNDILLFLLDEGADFSLGYWKPREPGMCGALYFASAHGHERTVKHLLDCKHEVLPGFSLSANVSNVAIQGGNLNLVRMYLEKPEISPRAGLGMVRDAVRYNQEHIARWLLQNGADITNENPDSQGMGPTPLEMAASRGRLSMVRLLLEYDCNRHGSPLAGAALYGYNEVVNLLLDTAGEDNIKALLHGKKPFRPRYSKHDGGPLLYATFSGEVEMVRLLLDRGVERDFPMQVAAERGEEEILRLLLEAEARLGIKRNRTELLTWMREQSHIPKRMSDLLLELSPTTRVAAIVLPIVGDT